MQRGFVTLENLYNKKKTQVQSLQQDLQGCSEEYVSTITVLLSKLDEDAKKIRLLSAEVEARGRDVATLSTELESVRAHFQGARNIAGEAKESVSRVKVVHSQF